MRTKFAALAHMARNHPHQSTGVSSVGDFGQDGRYWVAREANHLALTTVLPEQ
jgi:hypothetical protein